MNVIRNDELIQLMELIEKNPNGKFLISGAEGSGKTYLLNALGEALTRKGKEVGTITDTISSAGRISYTSEKYEKDIYFIDGLDKARNIRVLIEKISNSRKCFVCTATEPISNIKFDYELSLKELTESQIEDLVCSYIDKSDLAQDAINLIIETHDKSYIMPQNIIRYIYYYVKNEGLDKYFLELQPDSHQLYTYSDRLSLDTPRIIVPDHKRIIVPSEIKNDINVVSKSLIERVSDNPGVLYSITPRQFEELVCELFERNGYNAKLTKQTHDGGKDIIILEKALVGNLIIYAECKKYPKQCPVRVGLVRELYGTVEVDGATAGIMITTSYFSKEAQRFSERIKGRMTLMDYEALMKGIMDIQVRK